MRPINLNNVVEQSEGEFPTLEPGAYPCLITAVEDFPAKEYLRVLVDISMGERANYFSDKFYADKPFAHSLVFSYKESAMGMLKGRLHVISDCNPGVDAEAFINAGKEQALVGLAVGVVFRQEEYYDEKTGDFKLGAARPSRLCRFEEREQEKNAHPKPRMLTDDQKRDALNRKGLSYDEWRARKDGAARASHPAPGVTVAPASAYTGPTPF